MTGRLSCLIVQHPMPAANVVPKLRSSGRCSHISCRFPIPLGWLSRHFLESLKGKKASLWSEPFPPKPCGGSGPLGSSAPAERGVQPPTLCGLSPEVSTSSPSFPRDIGAVALFQLKIPPISCLKRNDGKRNQQRRNSEYVEESCLRRKDPSSWSGFY